MEAHASLQLIYERQSLNTTIPQGCHDICYAAELEAEAAGKTPSLCYSRSTFSLDLSDCETCIQEKEPNVKVEDVLYLDPALGPYLDYCNSVAIVSITVSALSTVLASTANTDTSLAPTSSSVSPSGFVIASAVSTILADITILLGSDSPITSTATVVVYTAPDMTITRTRTFSSNTSTDGMPSSGTVNSVTNTTGSSLVNTPGSTEGILQNRSVTPAEVAGATVGSLAGLIMVVSAFWFLLRRRRKRVAAKANGARDDDMKEKPQLHSDCIPYPGPYELHDAPRPSEVENCETFELPATIPWEVHGENSSIPETAASPVEVELECVKRKEDTFTTGPG